MSPVVQALVGASGLAAAVLAVWLVLRLRPRSRTLAIGWRVDTDQPLRSDDPAAPGDTGWMTFTLGGDLIGSYHARVDDPSVVILRLRNAGRRPIRDDDWGARLAFTFPGRGVVAAEVVETTTARAAADRGFDFDVDQVPTGGSRLVLRAVRLDPKDKAVMLAVLLSGRGHGIQASGLLRGGRIIQERPGHLRLRLLP
jgi:hypothetical protein